MAKIKPEQKRMGRSFIAGGIVLAVLAVLTAVTFTAINGLPGRPTTIYKAAFNDIHSLAVNDDVRQNSKRIGRVSAEEVQDGKAVVTLEIDGDYTLYKDARAEVWDVSALAAKFVELTPGTPAAGAVPAGFVIPADRNADSVDIYQLLNVFDPQTRVATEGFLRQFGGGQLAHGQDAHDFLTSAPRLLNNLGTVSSDIASPVFDLPDLIRSSNSLVGRFKGREQQISSLIRQVNTTFQAINVDDGNALRDTVAKAPGTLRVFTPALDALNQPLGDTGSAMSSLQPGAKGLADATPELRGFFRDALHTIKIFTPWSNDLQPVVGDLTDTVSDAHKIVRRAKDTFADLDAPLNVLAPYGSEMGRWFTRMHSFVSKGAEPGKRYAHLALTFGAPEATTPLVKADQKRFIDPYPKPEQSEREHLGPGLPAGLPIGGGNR